MLAQIYRYYIYMYLDIYKNIYISIIMERYIYVMIHETDFRKNISIIQTIGTKYLPLVQIQFFKCVLVSICWEHFIRLYYVTFFTVVPTLVFHVIR